MKGLILLIFILPFCTFAEDEDPAALERPIMQRAQSPTSLLPVEEGRAPAAQKSQAKSVYEGFQPGDKSAAAGHSVLEESIVIKTELDYVTSKKKVRTERVVFLSKERKNWFSLTSPRDGVVLLGKVVESGREAIKLEYLIVDTANDDAIISTPVLTAPIGQKTIINLDGTHEKVTVSLLTKYRSL